MEEIMVSVICNTYNHVKYIGYALDGFVKQVTNFKFEVLVHDDASSDGTADVIRGYEEKYPNLILPIYEKENIGKGFTLEYQYPRARGKYIAYCEGDDFWADPYKLQKQVDFLESHADYIGCVHKYIVVDEDNKEQEIRTFGYYESPGRYTLHNYEEEELPSQIASLVCRNIFKGESLEKLKELYSVSIQGDIKLYLFLLLNGDIYRMDDTMSAYRFVFKPGGSSWSSRTIGKNRRYYKDWKAMFALEAVTYEEFGVRINMNKRKLTYAKYALGDFIHHFKADSFLGIADILIHQKGIFRLVLGKVFHTKLNCN